MQAERNSPALMGQAQGILPVTRFGVFSYACRCWGPRAVQTGLLSAQSRISIKIAPLLAQWRE